MLTQGRAESLILIIVGVMLGMLFMRACDDPSTWPESYERRAAEVEVK